MHELTSLFRRCFPWSPLDDSYAEAILLSDTNKILAKRNEQGALIGAAVWQDDRILLLCVDEACRRRGIGSELLAEAERHIREAGHSRVQAGLVDGESLLPGVPSANPIWDPAMPVAVIREGLSPSGVSFFRKHGYTHQDECDLFDMQMDLADFHAVPSPHPGIRFRWATEEDIAGILSCTDDADPDFSSLYSEPHLYGGDGAPERVLIAEDGADVVGVLMVMYATGAPRMGCIGCTAVKHTHRGRKIATNLVILGTQSLRDRGLRGAWLDFTYTDLAKLYGTAGYRICTYYYMAKKRLEKYPSFSFNTKS